MSLVVAIVSDGATWLLADSICRRAFSSPEVIAYELTIAPALARVVVPEIRARFRAGKILDVPNARCCSRNARRVMVPWSTVKSSLATHLLE
jgi:hypothetical protein